MSLQPPIGRWYPVLWATLSLIADLPVRSSEYLEAHNSAIVPQPQEWHEWHSKFKHFVQLPHREEISLIFLGDSITEGWSEAGKEVWEEYYAPRGAANFGISGDRTQQLLWRIKNGNLDGLSPCLVVLLIGTNNIKEQRNSVQETTEGIVAVTEAIMEKLPNSRILLLGIFPCGEFSDCQNRQDARAVNQRLRSMILQDKIEYLELDQEFVEPNGRISPQIMPDYLHLSSRGYQRWANAMEPYIKSYCGDLTVNCGNMNLEKHHVQGKRQHHDCPSP